MHAEHLRWPAGGHRFADLLDEGRAPEPVAQCWFVVVQSVSAPAKLGTPRTVARDLCGHHNPTRRTRQPTPEPLGA